MAALVAGILIAAGVTTLTLSQSPSGCRPGPPLAHDAHSLTPYVLLNSPYLGSAVGGFIVWNNSSGSPSSYGQKVYASNGTVAYQFEDFQWTIFGAVSSRPGADCLGRYFAASSDNGAGGVSQFGFNLKNDSHEPTWSGDNGTSYARIDYNNSFYRANEVVSTCGQTKQVLGLTSQHVDIGIPVTINGSNVTVPATVDILSYYTYTFPANGGVWAVDNLSAPGGPGGGWAFSYSPCP